MDENNDAFVVEILHDNQHTDSETVDYKNISTLTNNTNQDVEKNGSGESSDKHSSAAAVWTTSATLTLLKLYEANIEMVETPKKKTRLWVAISDNLKSYNIEMSPDQVRWKINALTKKYKQAVDSGQKRFKYFKEMNNIFGEFENEDDFNTEQFQRKKNFRKNHLNLTLAEPSNVRGNHESKASIELRKIRLANRIEADRTQSKINLEKQWLEYLNRQEEQRQWRDETFEKTLRLREKELQLRKKELEMKEAFEMKKLQMKEKEQEELLKIEKKKCNILSKMVEKRKQKKQQQSVSL